MIQEAFLKASRREQPWESKEHMMSWIYLALASARIDAHRQEGPSESDGPGPKVLSLSDGEENLEASPGLAPFDRIAVQEALAQLKSTRAAAFQVIELRDPNPETLSQRDVAKALQLSEHRVRQLETIGSYFLRRRLQG